MDDFDKNDRRPVMGRLTSALSSIFSPVIKGPETPYSESAATTNNVEGDKAEEYYEDPYNDYPWRCSFGTHEDVSISTTVD